MIRLLLVFSLLAPLYLLSLPEKNAPIQIKDSRDYAILEEFLRKGFSGEEEYGYVLEGIKPISIRNFQPMDSFLTPRYLDWELLAHEAIPIWNRVCDQRKNFVFKVVFIHDPQFIAPGFELQFINISCLKEVIEENLTLFRYILGPLLTTEQLIDRIAYSDQPLSDVLNDNLTLIGIVLGFGLHNSLVEGKIETLFSQVLTRDEAPFLPQHQFFQNATRQSFIMPEEMYRLYYLEFAGGEESAFREKVPPVQAGLGFSDMDEELEAFKAQEEPLPLSLQKENPRFIFAAFKGEPSNQTLFERLQHAQKGVQSLLKEENFLEKVLEKIGGEKPVITCAKPITSCKELFKQREKEWHELLWSAAKKFDNEGQLAFINAFCQPTESSRQHPWALGVSQATLQGLKIARSNLAIAENKFLKLSRTKKPQIKELVKRMLYFETTENGTGKMIAENIDRVRVNYVVEDQNSKVLFAKYNVWIHLRDTIAGFAHGIQGMHIGENRTLYIHPALAYGALSTLPSCISLTIKVHLLQMDEQMLCKKLLSPIKPHDLSWVNDSVFYKNIEESLPQIPRYVGSFYRDWLDKRGGLNMKFLTSTLKNSNTETLTRSSIDGECQIIMGPDADSYISQ